MVKIGKRSCDLMVYAHQSKTSISNLSDSIISHILSFLPIKDVIATSVLSKQWRFIWRQVPTLIFRLTDEEEPDAFVKFVYRVLLFSKSEILQKFKVDWWTSDAGGTGFQDVNIWIDHVIARNVRELDIEVNLDRNEEDIKRYVLTNLFTCGTLESLRYMGLF